MDEPGLGWASIQETLDYLDKVNHLLGGHSNLISGLNFFRKRLPQKKNWNILDLGCANGKSLEIISKWGAQHGLSVSLSGLDMNPAAIQMARENQALTKVNFVIADVFDPKVDFSNVDVVTGNLFFHHLTDAQIVALINKINKAGSCLLINDLHRSRLAWVLFKGFTFLTNAPKMAKNDGEVSIRRAFKKSELSQLAASGGFLRPNVKWNWAFRYLVTLYNEK